MCMCVCVLLMHISCIMECIQNCLKNIVFDIEDKFKFAGIASKMFGIKFLMFVKYNTIVVCCKSSS